MEGGQRPEVLPVQRDPTGPARGTQTFILTNIQRLITPSGKTKSSFLSDQAVQNQALLVAVTETWLHKGVYDAEVLHNFPGFSIFRCDRAGRQGGGVAIYLRDDLTGELIDSIDNGVCELLIVHVHQIDTVVAVCYRPPNTRLSEFSPILKKLDSVLSDLPEPIPNIVLMGDFNLPDKDLSWVRSEAGDLVPLVHGHRHGDTDEGFHVRHQAALLCELALKHSLIQQVDHVTHGREILDLIYTNNCDLVSSVKVDPWPCFTDHSLVTATMSFMVESGKKLEDTHLLESGKKLKRLNFNKASWPEIQKEFRMLNRSPMEALDCTSAAFLWFLEGSCPIESYQRKIKEQIS